MTIRRVAFGLVAIGVLWYLTFGRAEWYRFAAARDAWHARCDAYVGRTIESREVRECEADLQRLVAWGKREGWD